ncbi:aspartic peptidase domain-containing protein [Rhodofomes roseus]|uniref:Aspartic peptidase domain-containing protein n=1 Tax=Rhodofomes roseus TaxID=34475 RepID=A0ABQ8KV19_9APHY|nr:aspartic peptidase domain-containing protein [Rhodofomes roseus]KAH9842834.1 aspartic peptidase domain-containing protein [Rhodofomes roseus]
MGAPGINIPITPVPRYQGANAQGTNGDVSLSNSNEYAYLVDVGIGGQTFEVLLDTGSSDLWVVSSNCTTQDCAEVPKFDTTDTANLTLSGAAFHLGYLLGSVTGSIVADTVALGSYEVSSQVLALANGTSGLDLSGTGYSGILGLTFPAEASIAGTYGQTFIDNVFASLDEDDRFFAYKLGRNKTDSSFAIGQLDPTYANSSSNFTYIPVSSAGTNDGQYNFWKVPLQYITINSTRFDLSKTSVSGASTNIGILDTGTTLLLGPSADVERFWQSVGNTRNTDSGWQVRCNRAAIVGFVLGDGDNQQEFVLDPADVNWEPGSQQDGWCMGGIQANDGVFSGDWLLGDTFLRNVYAVHHAATNASSHRIGLLGMTDPTAALAQFRAVRGDDTTAPGQVHSRAPRSTQLTGADVCGVAVVCGFVFGVILALLLHIWLEPRSRGRKIIRY